MPVFGYPITIQLQVIIEGKPFQAQWFERNRLELHPENPRPYDVLLGRLGGARLFQQDRDWTKFARVNNASSDCLFFSQTGHSVCEPFLSYFKSNGLEFDGQPGKILPESVTLFGLPISQPTTETNDTGGSFLTQWFERARFEWHPEKQPPFNVLLGLLGNEWLDNFRPVVMPLPPPPPPTPTPPPANNPCSRLPVSTWAVVSPAKCVTVGTAVVIDVGGFMPDEQVGFWLTNPNGQIVLGTNATVSADSSGKGRLNTSNAGRGPGVWKWVFEGVTSKHQAIAYYLLQ